MMTRFAWTSLVWLGVSSAAWAGTVNYAFVPSGTSATTWIADQFYNVTFDGACSTGVVAGGPANCVTNTTGASVGLPGEGGAMSAGADLSDGSLSVSGDLSGSPNVYAHASAFVQDTLNFQGFGNPNVQVGTITMTGSGSVSGLPYSTVGISLQEEFYFGTTLEYFNIGVNTSTTGSSCVGDGPVPGYIITECTSSDGTNLALSMTFPLNSTGLNFQAGIAGTITDGTMSATDPMSVSLPAGVTFSSQSGLFLTQSPTPEPATFAMLLAGLFLVGYRVKNLNQQAAARFARFIANRGR